MKNALKISALILAMVLPAIFSLELILALKNSRRSETFPHTFNKQYLHPHYFFFFPSNPEKLKQMNSEDAWIDTRGYRDIGPEGKKDRKLAFLLGGSTAFGWGNPNSETITWYLNHNQKEFYFVNAGVPSWNSYQELLRLLKQVLDEKPELIISLTGGNDFFQGLYYEQNRFPYPLDTPESFDQLEAKVEDIRSTKIGILGLLTFLSRDPIFRHIFLPETLKMAGMNPLVDRFLSQSNFDNPPKKGEYGERISKAFSKNVQLSQEICENRKIKYKAFLQPIRSLAAPADSDQVRGSNLQYNKFIENSLKALPGHLIDYTTVFGSLDHRQKAEYFIDEFHLTAKGNEFMANKIISKLGIKLRSAEIK